MATECIIIRNNKTVGKKNVKNKADEFKFENGLYFVEREKVFYHKNRPMLIYAEGISQAINFDNFKIMEYYEEIPVTDEHNNILIDQQTKKPITKTVKTNHITDTFIDSRAIHNLTDKKVLSVLTAKEEIAIRDIIIVILIAISIGVGVVGLLI